MPMIQTGGFVNITGGVQTVYAPTEEDLNYILKELKARYDTTDNYVEVSREQLPDGRWAANIQRKTQ